MGAELLFYGRNFDDAREYAESLAMDKGSDMSIQQMSRC